MTVARPRAGLAAAVAVAALVGGALAAVPADAAAPTAPVVSPAPVLANERVTVTGSIPGRTARSVQLQEYRDKRWRTVERTRSRSGAYRVTHAFSTARTIRTYAPKTSRYSSFTSSRITVAPVADTVSVSVAPDDGTVVVTAAAPRPGRPVTVQARARGGAWQDLATDLVEDDRGQARLTAYERTSAPREFRALLGAWNGAAAVAPVVGLSTDADLRPTAPVELSLTTQDGAPIASRETYLKGSMVLGGSTYALQVRGRGNSTWNEDPERKNPYRIKLDKKAGLLGMPEDKDWVLLANAYDRSLLRNDLALELGRYTSLGWTPRTRFVDLTLNGEPRGSYLLVEHVKLATSRANVPAGGLLLEADDRVSTTDDPYLATDHHKLAYKDPGSPTTDQVAALTTDVKALEDALYADGGPDPAWRGLVDLDAAADWYLVNELFKNPDADFYTSVFLTWSPGRFTMGPLWDFDIGGGLKVAFRPEASEPTGWYLHDNPRDPQDHWVAKMLDDPQFAARVAERWRALSPVAHAMADQVVASGAALGASATSNFDQWGDTGNPFPGSFHGTSYADELDYLSTWLDRRADWIDAQLN